MQTSTVGQLTIDRKYDGGWAATFWRFEFSKDGTFKLNSRGHFGNKTKTGTYQIFNDTLEIIHGYQNTAGTINRYYLIQSDTCIVDTYLRYAYCVLDTNIIWQYADERPRNIKYPQTKASNRQLIKDLDSVLAICFNEPAITKYFKFKKLKKRQPILLPYFEINGQAEINFTIDNRIPVFKEKEDLSNDFYIEITDINQNEGKIDVEFRIPIESVNFYAFFEKVAGKWILKSISDFHF